MEKVKVREDRTLYEVKVGENQVKTRETTLIIGTGYRYGTEYTLDIGTENCARIKKCCFNNAGVTEGVNRWAEHQVAIDMRAAEDIMRATRQKFNEVEDKTPEVKKLYDFTLSELLTCELKAERVIGGKRRERR